MPNDPRAFTRWDELHRQFVTVAYDSSVNAPTVGVGGFVPSTDLGAAVTLVNTGTNTPQVGKGSAGNEFFGVLKQVNDDGFADVQDEGYFLVAYNTGTAPTVNNPVGVDGAGKVELVSGNKQAFCVGFMNDPLTGTLKCIVHKP